MSMTIRLGDEGTLLGSHHPISGNSFGKASQEAASRIAAWKRDQAWALELPEGTGNRSK